jgi:hypothetical protein
MTFRNFPTRDSAQDAEDGRRHPFGRRVGGVRARRRRPKIVVAVVVIALAAGAAWLAVQIAQAI